MIFVSIVALLALCVGLQSQHHSNTTCSRKNMSRSKRTKLINLGLFKKDHGSWLKDVFIWGPSTRLTAAPEATSLGLPLTHTNRIQVIFRNGWSELWRGSTWSFWRKKTHSSPGSFLFQTLPVFPHAGSLLKQAPVVQRVRVRYQRSAGGREVKIKGKFAFSINWWECGVDRRRNFNWWECDQRKIFNLTCNTATDPRLVTANGLPHVAPGHWSASILLASF